MCVCVFVSVRACVCVCVYACVCVYVCVIHFALFSLLFLVCLVTKRDTVYFLWSYADGTGIFSQL